MSHVWVAEQTLRHFLHDVGHFAGLVGFLRHGSILLLDGQSLAQVEHLKYFLVVTVNLALWFSSALWKEKDSRFSLNLIQAHFLGVIEVDPIEARLGRNQDDGDAVDWRWVQSWEMLATLTIC